MAWTCRSLSVVTTLLALLAGRAGANEAVDAKWIWFDAGDPLTGAEPGQVWFRREVRADEPSTGEIRIAAADPFELWINGQKIGSGEAKRGYRFNLNGVVDRGPNVVAVRVENKEGPAGLLVDGEVRSQGGRSIPFDSSDEWRATRTAPADDGWLAPRFPMPGWTRAKVLADHANSPWKEISFGDSYLDRFQLAPGFELTRIGEPELVGSLVAITWGNRGRLLVSRERGPIVAVIDVNGDGTFDKVVEYTDQVTNCQGLCMVGDDLYAVGDGPDDKGAGLYRLPDADGDDRADRVELLHTYKGGMGEHGPHDVVYGPDGWLYNNLGNHAWVTSAPEPTTPVRGMYEGDLLQPRMEDAHGHAAGIKVPGGTAWRFSPDGKKWWLHTAGYRNQYDIAFNAAGELFTFDSDMEWDVGAPWYRPIRVNHCIPGSDFGWRSGAGNWPEYYFDSLPGTVDIGRGSPTGVVFYEHDQFPPRYRGALLVCDWSIGRIIATRLEPAGASYTGTWENLVVGNPLNVSDIEVDRDGSVVFATGGRGTEGGLYRVRHAGSTGSPARADTLDDVVRLPQPQAAWSRELARQGKVKLGARWENALVEKAKSGTAAEQVRALTLLTQHGPAPATELLLSLLSDEDSSVRAFVLLLLGDRPDPAVASALAKALADPDARVQRHACEAFVRGGMTPPADALLAFLERPDRWLRFAARVALERVPSEQWRLKILESSSPRVILDGLLALQRLGNTALSADIILEKEVSLLASWDALNPTERLDTLRLIQVTLAHGAGGSVAGAIGQRVLPLVGVGEGPIPLEAARIATHLRVPGTADALVAALRSDPDSARQIHYALMLRYLTTDWDLALQASLLDWYETTKLWEGGHSLVPFLVNIVGASVDRFSAVDRRKLLESWATRPFASRLILRRSTPAQIDDYDGLLATIVARLAAQPSLDPNKEFVDVLIEALDKSGSPRAQELLRGLFESEPDQRDRIARALAHRPSEENWPFLTRALVSDDPTTLQACLKALAKIEKKPEGPALVRAAIVAGMRLPANLKPLATTLLDKWVGSDPLAYYQQWFLATFPNEPRPELAAAPKAESKYALDQLVNFLDRDPKGREGDVERGRQVFAKANCAKCHQFQKEGQGVGPDLTSVRRRFQRKEIVEAIVDPSKIISDQYKSVTVVTSDGLVHTGLPAKQEGASSLTLWLSNATKLEIPVSDIEEQKPATISVMPAGLLDPLSLPEIADLFAFLETSKLNDLAPGETTARSGAPVGGN